MEKHGENREIAGAGIDKTDLEILRTLQSNARTPFLEMARRLGVSGATVHERVRAMERKGIIEGFTTRLNQKLLGYGVTAIVGVTLEHPSLDLQELKEGLLSIPEITEAHNLTGDTDLLLTIKARGIEELRSLLTDRVQHLPGVKRLSTSIVLDSPVSREIGF
jgi:Lrp/AsnC family transcriptional regulator, regulator for asnA, asnC and gidA